MVRWRLVISALVAVGSLGCTSQPAGRKTTDVAAAMLFAGYETVAKAEVAVLPFHLVGRGQTVDHRRSLFAPFSFLFAALRAAAPKADERVMSETAFVLGGMKDFRAPMGLGAVHSRNCYVLIVKRGFDLSRLLGRPANERWEGLPVWRWTANLHEYGELDDRVTNLVALQMPPYVLVSNDPDQLFANAQRLRQGATDALQTLTEWRDAASHDYWVYRRARFDTPDLMAAGLDLVRRDAESLLLLYDRDQPGATLRIVGRDGVATAPITIIPDGRVPPLGPISPRAWETQLPFVHPIHDDAWFIVMGTFGFAVYL